MSNRQVEYCRAENWIDFPENGITNETIVYRGRRNGMSKLEKFLLACIVLLVFLCAIFAGLYLSERQHRHLEKDVASNGEDKCKSNEGSDGDINKRNETENACGSDGDNASCVSEVVKQVGAGKFARISSFS